MTNKYILSILLCFTLCWSCKPPAKSFQFEKHVQLPFFKKLEKLLKGKIDSIKIYRATMEDVLVERDNVTEFKLINIESKQPTVDFQVDNNYAQLYLIQLFTTPSKGRPCIFLSTGFTADSTCTHLGPSYLGFINMDHINVKKELHMKQGARYYIKNWTNKTLEIITKENFPTREDREQPVSIKQILVLDPNKIGGRKPVVFTIEEILKDPDALLFTYLETIKK